MLDCHCDNISIVFSTAAAGVVTAASRGVARSRSHPLPPLATTPLSTTSGASTPGQATPGNTTSTPLAVPSEPGESTTSDLLMTSELLMTNDLLVTSDLFVSCIG